MSAIHFVDTTLRDGHLSLWATNMRTAWMQAVAQDLDSAGFLGAEIVDPAHFKKCVRELREDPLERVRLMAQRMPNTPLRVIVTRIIAFDLHPDCLTNLYLERLAANGARQARIADPSNTPAHWRRVVAAARNAGLEPIINLIYSLSPRHTDQYYVERARLAAGLDVARVCLKDPGGLLTPDRVRSLVPTVRNEIGDLPLEIHTHCTTGLGPLCYLEAVKLGVRILNVAIPPLANGSGNPSVFNVVHNLHTLGCEVALKEDLLRPVSEHFDFIARRESLPRGVPVEYDEFHYLHQLPGGMISNLRHQLRLVGVEARLADVLHETARVRAELGYPIMVTPYSQFVGSQAAINVMVGERYREVTDQVIQYALGFWGEEEAAAITPEVRDRILARPRAQEIAHWEPPQDSIGALRQRFGGPGVSDDDLLLRYFASAEDVAAMRAAPPAHAVDGRYPLAALVSELCKRRTFRRIHVQEGNLSIQLGSGT